MNERELSAEEEAEISRLLADAASPAPIPADVAARLDDVLAGLVAERTEEPDVVPLRSRRWPKVLVAAAAVSLFGYAGTSLIRQSADDNTTFAERGVAGDVASEDAPEVALPPTVPGHAPAPTATVGPGEATRDDAAGDLDGLSQELFANATKGSLVGGDELAYGASAGCGLPATFRAAGNVYDVRLTKQRRAFLVVKAVNANAARVDVYSCKRPLLPISSKFVLAAR